MILPVLLLLYHYNFKKKLEAKKFLPVVSLVFMYVVLRITALKTFLSSNGSSTTLFQRLPGFFVALTNYIRILFLPFNLHMEYGERLFNPGKAILGIVIFIIGLSS